VARAPKAGPLALAVAACVALAVFGTALVGNDLGTWYAGLKKPRFLVPLWGFYVVAALYYASFATVLYRLLVHVERRGRAICLSLALLVMLCNELWNYFFFGWQSTLAGFLGIALFLVPLSFLLLALWRHERTSAKLLVPYYLWVLYDLAWTFELWRLNGS
jgi:tryptophan-rich sensory protein